MSFQRPINLPVGSIDGCRLELMGTTATIAVTLSHLPDTDGHRNLSPSRRAALNTSTPDVRLGVLAVRLAMMGAVAAGIVLEHGFVEPPVAVWLIHLAQVVLFIVYTLDVWLGSRLGRSGLKDANRDWIDALLVACAAVGIAMGGLFVSDVRTSYLFEVSVVLMLFGELWRLNIGLSRLFNRPGLLLPVSFLTLIAIGTPLLKVPMAVPVGGEISWLDALFTITSAVCVTGLGVRDTATQFTPYGQAVIIVFIQIGGLGIIIFGSLLLALLGGRISLRENVSLSTLLHDLPLHRVVSLVRFIVLTTLLFELAGALALVTLWEGHTGFRSRFFVSLFHSISAFCNAGFSLQSNSLESYRYAPQVHLVIAPLLVLGGLGFPVLDNLWRAAWGWWIRRRSASNRRFQSIQIARDVTGRLNLHTKIVLSTTAVLYLYGVVILAAGGLQQHAHAFFQQGITFNHQRPEPLSIREVGAVLADASFMSLTARTAGFNTVPMNEVSSAGRFAIITLMMIGASPGGTGGGMKATTLALLLLTVAATLRRRDHTEAFARRLSEQLVRKAATIAVCFVALATAATGLLCFSEPYPFEKIAFEAVSAASTTGLSLGITSDLTSFGKMVIIATMFLGRIGPLALLGALQLGSYSPRAYAYAREDVSMG